MEGLAEYLSWLSTNPVNISSGRKPEYPEETGVPGENPRLLAERWPTLLRWLIPHVYTCHIRCFGSWSLVVETKGKSLFKKMYSVEVDFGLLTIKKLIKFVFTEMMHKKIQELVQQERAKRCQSQSSHRKKSRQRIEDIDEAERWMTYAERSLSFQNHKHMWKAIVEGCKILKYPEPSSEHWEKFEILFYSSRFLWFEIFSEFERTASMNHLIDYIKCVISLLQRQHYWLRQQSIILTSTCQVSITNQNEQAVLVVQRVCIRMLRKKGDSR